MAKKKAGEQSAEQQAAAELVRLAKEQGLSKTVLTERSGPVEIDVPRDRAGSFEPQIVRKRQRRLIGVDEVVLSLYAKGLTTGARRRPPQIGVVRPGHQPVKRHLCFVQFAMQGRALHAPSLRRPGARFQVRSCIREVRIGQTVASTSALMSDCSYRRQPGEDLGMDAVVHPGARRSPVIRPDSRSTLSPGRRRGERSRGRSLDW